MSYENRTPQESTGTVKHINFNLIDLENEVRRLAAENPAFVYQAPENDGVCMYTVRDDDGNPVGSCLFGQALSNLGVGPEELRHYEHVSIGVVLKRAMLISPSRTQWFDDVQSGQDAKRTWGYAVAQADNYRARRRAADRTEEK